MGLAFVHNPDWLTTADLPLVWDAMTPGVEVVPMAGYQGAGMTGVVPGYVRKAVKLVEPVRFAVGCRIKILTLPSSPLVVLGVTDSSLAVHCCIALQPSGTLTAHPGLNVNDPPLRWAETGTLNLNYWTRIGFEGVLNASLGNLHIYVQGQTHVYVDDVPLGEGGVQGGILVGTAPNFVTGHYYMTDYGTTGRQGLLKDLLVKTQYPAGVGTLAQFAPEGAPTLDDCVDDTAQDGDLTYAHGTGKAKMSFPMAPIVPLPRPVYGTRITSVMKAEGVNNARTRMLSVINGKSYPASNFRTFEVDKYSAQSDIVEVNPVTNRAWTMAQVTAAQAGVGLEGDPPWFFASGADRAGEVGMRRFEPKFWLCNFNRPMVAICRTLDANTVQMDMTFYTKGDLAGLIWESDDLWDHLILKYNTSKDFRGVEWYFHYISGGLPDIGDEFLAPVLTIEGKDETGKAKVWFIRLYNYADNTGSEANITLVFDNLKAGWYADEPFYAGKIDRIFFAAVSPDYEKDSTEILPSPQHAYLRLADIEVQGPNLVLYQDRSNNVTPFQVATGFDDNYNLTPERLLYNIYGMGYRGTINHYIGMSHYYDLAGDPLVATGSINMPCRRWHENFFELAHNLGYDIIISWSYEMFNEVCPEAWKQRDVYGQPALTGWEPPSTLLSPTNPAAMGYLRDIASSFCQMAFALGMTVKFQVGEPWWWVRYDTLVPYYYDQTAKDLYLAEKGLVAPPITTMEGSHTPAELAYLTWLGEKLAASTQFLCDAMKVSFPGAISHLLFYAPQVMASSTPDTALVNRPVGWNSPAFDILQLEDYDFVIEGNVDGSLEAAEAVTALMGYPVNRQHYFSGFVLTHEEAGDLWPLIYDAAVVALDRGVPEVYFWAMPQINRDGFVVRNPWAGRVTQLVRELAYSEVPSPLEPLGPCEGYGQVPMGNNPPLGIDLEYATTPLVWVEFEVGGGLPSPKRAAKIALNYAQRKEPRLIAAGSVTRALSDTNGFMETASATVTLDDTDLEIRRAIEVDNKRALYNRDASIYVADKATLDSGGAPRRVFYGKIKGVAFPNDFQVEFTLEDILTFEKSPLAADAMYPRHMIASSIVDETGGRKPDVTNWPAPLCYGGLTDEDTDDPIGVVPTTYIQATSQFSEDLGNINMFFVCLGVVKEIQSVYGANFWEEGEEPVTRARIPDEAYGDWLFVPGKPGWPSSNPWYEVDGKRYTVIVAKDNPASIAAREGRIPFVVNLCGYEDVGDGSGSMIASLPKQMAHFLINFVLNDYDGNGNWQTEVPTVAWGAYSALDMDSFDYAKLILDNMLGRVHTGAFMVGHSQRQVSFSDLMASFMTSMGFNARVFLNRNGQVALSVLDRFYSYYDAMPLTQERHLAERAQFSINAETVENIVQYSYARRYAPLLAEVTEDQQVRAREPIEDDFMSGVQRAEDGGSQAAQERDAKSEVQNMEMIRIGSLANAIVQHRLDWMKIPRVTVDLPLTSLIAADLELGQVVKITHEQGIDHLGWTDRRCIIERIVIDLDNESSTITVRDLYDLISDVTPEESSRIGIGRIGRMKIGAP